MIQFAVMTFMYDAWADSDKGSHDELIEILGTSGATGIEAFANTFIGRPELVKCYQTHMPQHNVTMPVMDLIANLAHNDKVERANVYETMRKGIDICDALGTEIVHLAGCSLVDGVSPEDGKKLIAEGLNDFVDDVEKRGMTLAFEDFDPSPNLICSCNDCLDIISMSDKRVKIVFDTGNFEAVNERAEDNFDDLINKTCHFHFKDLKKSTTPRGYEGARFGEGIIANQTIAQMINNSNYSGWVALESYPQGGDTPKETIHQELKLLKAMFFK